MGSRPNFISSISSAAGRFDERRNEEWMVNIGEVESTGGTVEFPGAIVPGATVPGPCVEGPRVPVPPGMAVDGLGVPPGLIVVTVEGRTVEGETLPTGLVVVVVFGATVVAAPAALSMAAIV